MLISKSWKSVLPSQFLPQWIIFFCAVYDSLVTKPLHESNLITDYKRGAVQCAAAGIRNLIIDQFSMTSMRVWSRKTLSEWLAFKEAYLNVLCLAIVLRALFEKYSINLFSSLQEFPFDALTLIGFSRRLIKSMDTTPLKYLKVRFFKTIRDKIKIKIRIIRIFRWEKKRCT